MKYLIIVILFLTVSCENDKDNQAENNDDDKPVETNKYQEYVDNGWKAFRSKNYTDAESKFLLARMENENGVEGHLGFSWSVMLKSKDRYFNKANLSLHKIITTLEPNNVPALAAQAIISNVLNQFSTSMDKIQRILILTKSWEFAHDKNFNMAALYKLAAQNEYQQGYYRSSLKWIKRVDSSFSADITSFRGRMELLKKIESYNPGL